MKIPVIAVFFKGKKAFINADDPSLGRYQLWEDHEKDVAKSNEETEASSQGVKVSDFDVMRISELKTWLKENGGAFKNDMKKAELVEICKALFEAEHAFG